MKKLSIFSQLESTSATVKTLQAEVSKERKSFIESLTSDQMANLFPQGANLGTFSNNKPITQTDIAQQDGATPVATTPDGTTIMTDPTTGQPIVVSNDPDKVKIQSPEDVQKLTQLALLARQAAQIADPSKNVNTQTQTSQQNVAAQKSAQQQNNKISEDFEKSQKVDDIHSFMDDLNQIFTSGPLDKNKNPKPHSNESAIQDTVLASEEEEKPKSSEEEVKDESNSQPADEELVQVDNVSDNFTDVYSDTAVKDESDSSFVDPMDTISSLATSFWQPSNQDLTQTVKDSQQNLGVTGETPVIEKPISVPNMRQYVKTGATRGTSSPGIVDNFSADDFGDVMGLDSPISIKLSLEVNK
jgi:hypothetical protein